MGFNQALTMASADEEEDCSRQLEQQHGSFVSRVVSWFAGHCHRDGPNGGLLDWCRPLWYRHHFGIQTSLK